MWNWLDKWVLAGERLFLSFVWLFSPIYKKFKNLLKYFQFTWFLTCNFPFSHPGKKTFSWKNIFSLGFAHESLFFLCVYFFPQENKNMNYQNKKKLSEPFFVLFFAKNFLKCLFPLGFTLQLFFFSSDRKRKNHDEMIFSCVGLSEKVLTGEKTIRKANIS